MSKLKIIKAFLKKLINIIILFMFLVVLQPEILNQYPTKLLGNFTDFDRRGKKPMRNAFILILSLSLNSCGSGSKSGSVEGSTETGSCSAPIDVPTVPAAAGQFAFTLPDTIDSCSVGGYVVGYEGVLRVEQTTEGSFVINNIPAGQLDIIITGNGSDASLSLDKKEKDRGIRVKKSKILNGVKTDGGKIDLPKVGVITGRALLNEQTDHAGIDVYIPGTDYIAKTDSGGRFAFSAVPVGTHNLYFEKDGYHRGQVEEIDVTESSETKLDDITLVISTGAEGLIVIENGAAIANSRTVSIVVGATEDAVLMKYSESNTFEGASWKPVKSSMQYTFDSQGEKKLYVKFANANGLESSPYSDTVTIDIFSDGTTLFSPSYSVASVVPPNSTFTLSAIALPTNATAMMVSTSSIFSGASWEAIAAQKQISVPANYSSCGSKTFYVKFKDKDGFESPIESKSAELNCWQSVSRSGAPSARERHSAVWTGSQMIIWGGTTTTSDDLNDGGIYSPSAGTWSLISASGSPTPRWQHKAIWTGNKMIIWGGYNSSTGSLNTGSIYDPENGSWTSISTTNAPSARNRHGMVWTGSKMIVFGGCASENSPFGDGGIYDPSLDTWSSLSMTNGPSARTEPAVVWTGTEMIVWGGMDGSYVRKFDAYAYNPTTNQWRTLTSSPSTENRQYYSYVWDGANLQIWGGITSAWQNTGSVFNFSSNSWASASINLSWKPAYQTIVSTGTALIFWGGTEDTKGVNNDGYILNEF